MKKRIVTLAVTAVLLFTPCLQAVDTYVDDTIHVFVNNKPVNVEVVMNKGSIYVPLRFMSDQLDAEVSWDKFKRIAKVNSTQKNNPSQVAYGELIISGSDEFKSEINKAMALIPGKVTLSGIREANLPNRSETNVTFANTDLLTSVCNIDFDECNRLKRLAKLTDRQFSVFLAGIIIHESCHAYTYSTGVANSLDLMEFEAIAFARQRQFLKKNNAPKVLLDLASIDELVDSNYGGRIK